MVAVTGGYRLGNTSNLNENNCNKEYCTHTVSSCKNVLINIMRVSVTAVIVSLLHITAEARFVCLMCTGPYYP